MRENDCDQLIALDGLWQFAFPGQPPRDIAVPSAWEDTQADWLTDGPARYTRTVDIEPGTPHVGQRIYFEADAVSFACTVFVNGHYAGDHRGLWTRFQIDITAFIQPGANQLVLDVWKPGRHIPMRQCMAGFLPDVANSFGGIWQSCRLRITTHPAAIALAVTLNDTLNVSAHATDTNNPVALTLNGETFNGDQAAIPIWQPGRANTLAQLQASLSDAGGSEIASARRRVARRLVEADGDVLRINGQCVHVRGVLDWGWQPESLAPVATDAAIRARFALFRELGFNLVKLCLYAPPDNVFEIADETGMLLWLELPLWQAEITAESRALILSEAEGILRRVQHHPALVLLSLGCELDASIDRGLLDDLRALARRYVPGVLRVDNSGSAEAYGGAPAEGDFYDHHFYCDPPFFEPLLNHFRRAHQLTKPWIFGEFCDADTLRDFSRLQPPPQWLSGPTTNQRDEIKQQQQHTSLLSVAGVTDGGATLSAMAREQAVYTRKAILETTRRNFASGGYVITHWRDNPLTASGILDDFDQPKFAPEHFRQFNADRVLLLDRERRRVWKHGGDRPSPLDAAVLWHDEEAVFEALLSNGSEALHDQSLHCQLDDEVIGAWHGLDAPAGKVSMWARVALPQRPARLAVRRMALHSGALVNEWPLLIVPRPNAGVLAQAESLLSMIDTALLTRAAHGDSVVVWLREPGVACVSRPFVREAIHTIDWPALSELDIRPFMCSVASDFALDTTALKGWIEANSPHRVTEIRPLWRRFDARALTWLDYVVAIKVGTGEMRISTLRHAGGLGTQPSGLASNPLGAYLLTRLLA